MGVRLLRPVGRSAVDALRGHVRAHRRRRRHAAHPLGDRRPCARHRVAVAARSPRAHPLRLRAWRSTSSGRARSCRTTARCSCSPPVLFTLRLALVDHDRRRRRTRRHGSSRWWRYERELDGHDTSWLTQPRPALAAWAADRRVPQRHASVAALAGVPLHRHRARPHPGARVVAARCDRNWFCAVLGRDVDQLDRQQRTRLLVLLSDDPFERGFVYTMSALGHGVAGVHRRLVARRALPRDDGGRLAATRRPDVAVDLHRPRPGVLPARRLARRRVAGRARHVTAVRTQLLADLDRGRVAYHKRFGRGPAEYVYRKLAS